MQIVQPKLSNRRHITNIAYFNRLKPLIFNNVYTFSFHSPYEPYYS